jgi:WD40 repeat protein
LVEFRIRHDRYQRFPSYGETVDRAGEPDPRAAKCHAEFRAGLRQLARWAGYASLQQLEAGAARRGTSMPVSTANRALNNDRLPTAEFVERMAIACAADVSEWLAARDALADRPYLRQAAETGQDEPGPVVCPYPGLAAFGPDQARWFFGREHDTADLLDLLADATGPLMVCGPSGTGKSSLLHAGLLPALATGRLPGSAGWTRFTRTPTADPPVTLPVCDVLVVDQFEELFTLCQDEPRRREFIDALCAAPARVVLGMRADFLGRCASYPGLVGSLRHGQLLLGPMTEAQLRTAVERPAAAAGLELQPGLVDVMLADLGMTEEGYQPGALPLLAHALLATWRHRTGRFLTIAGYRLTGGITGAIAKTAERVYWRLLPAHQELARTLLLRMIQLGDGTADTRRQWDRARLLAESPDPAGVSAVLDTLTDARLITAHPTTVEIVHEAVLQAWPRLRTWIDTDRAGLVAEQRLIAAAESWDRDGRHDSDLYRGHRLAAVQERVDQAHSRLPAPASEFLRTSLDRELAEARLTARRTRRLRRLLVVLSCLVLVAATTTVLAVMSRNDIARQRDLGISRQVADAAVALRTSNPDLAGQLAVASHRIAHTAEARGAMMTALVKLDPVNLVDVGSGAAVQAVAFSPDGKLLVAASRDHYARVWALGDPPSLAEPPVAVLSHPDEVHAAVFDPTGRYLATSSSDGTVRLWATANLAGEPQPVRVLEGPRKAVAPLAFSIYGTLLATGGQPERNVQLWKVADPGHSVRTFGQHSHDILAVAFSHSARMMATASADGMVKIWDSTVPVEPTLLWGHNPNAGTIHSVAFSNNDEFLVTGNGDTTATLWDIRNPQHPQVMSRLGGHLGGIGAVTFDPSGRFLATASFDNSARLWDVSDPWRPVVWAVPLAGDADNLYSVAFRRDGHTLATSSYGLAVRLWETDPDRLESEICRLVETVISREEWAHYVGDYPYRPPCRPAPRPQRPNATDDASSLLVAVHSNKCVTIRAEPRTPGASVHQFRCRDLSTERWTFPPVPGAGPKAYQIRNTASGMCLDARAPRPMPGGAGQVVQQPCAADPGQIWELNVEAQKGGTTEARFVNAATKDCLDVNHSSITDGAYLIHWMCNTQPNQTFRVDSSSLD